MLIVDGHSTHVAWPVVEYPLDHRIVPYCLPPYSTHLMQPLDIACFTPLGRAYRTALQGFIYEYPGQAFGKQEFWECVCIARDQALTKANILSGFEASGIWPLCLEKVSDRYQDLKEETAKPTPSTPFKIDSMREEALNLNMTPHSREILQKSLGYLASKVVQYRVIEPNSSGVKELRTGKQIKPRSQKQLQGPRTLDRAYVEEERTRIAKEAAQQVEDREVRRLAKEQKTKKPKSVRRQLKRQERVLRLLVGVVAQS